YQSSHHAPTSPQSLPEVLSRYVRRSPTFQTSRNNSWYHDHWVTGMDSLRPEMQPDREGIIVDSVAFVLLYKPLDRNSMYTWRAKPNQTRPTDIALASFST